jgi:hypothetical protein
VHQHQQEKQIPMHMNRIKNDRALTLFGMILLIGLAFQSRAGDKIERQLYLLRQPQILNAPGCKKPTGPVGVLLLDSDTTHKRGDKFSVVTEASDVVTAEIQTFAPEDCSPLGADITNRPAIVTFDKKFEWKGRSGSEALLAVGGMKLNKDQLGAMRSEVLPSSVFAQVDKSAPNGFEINGKGRVKQYGAIVSVPRSSEQYLIVPVLYTPPNWIGDAKSEVHRTTVWKKSEKSWTLTDFLDGDVQVFAVVDLARNGTIQLGMYLGKSLSGSYEFREIKNGKLVLKDTLYSWTD